MLGAALAVLGAKLALPAVPEFADTPAFPPLLVPIPPALVLAVAAVVAALLAAALGVSGAILLRAAVPARLREAQA